MVWLSFKRRDGAATFTPMTLSITALGLLGSIATCGKTSLCVLGVVTVGVFTLSVDRQNVVMQIAVLPKVVAPS